MTRRSLTSSIPYVMNTYVCVYIYLCARNARIIRSSFSKFARMIMIMIMMIERAYAFAFSRRRLNYNRPFRETGTETAGWTSVMLMIRNLILVLILARVTLRLRIANQVVMDSRCRGGIVHIRCGCSRALFVRPENSTALWRFRASTSNSPSGRSRPPTNTPMCQIDHTYARQGIRVCGDDHFQPPKRQSKNPKALSLLHVSI